MSNRDTAMEATIQSYEREFVNATTQYDRWTIFKRALDWSRTASDLAEGYQREKVELANRIIEQSNLIQKADREVTDLKDQLTIARSRK